MASADWSLEHVLQTFAYHVSVLRTDRGPSGMGLSAGPGSPSVFVKVRVSKADAQEPVWDQLEFQTEGGSWYGVGNRAGAVAEYTRLCTPVIAWAARSLAQTIPSDRKHWPGGK